MNHILSLDRNMPILVVDDLSAMRRIVRNCLKKLGFENVVEAENAQAAKAELEKGEFKFVISDWDMEADNGQDLFSAARNHEKLKELPFLMVAAEPQKRAVTEAMGEEAVLIIKPFTADLLQQKMAQIFNAQNC